jgi:integrase
VEEDWARAGNDEVNVAPNSPMPSKMWFGNVDEWLRKIENPSRTCERVELMPTLFKRNDLIPLPPKAVVTEKNGTKRAIWTDATGKRRKSQLSRAGDKIIIGESDRWFGKLRVGKSPHHRWKTVLLFTDKTASERELAKLQAREDQRAAGVITAEMEHAGKPLIGTSAKGEKIGHIPDYLAALKQVGVSDDHHRISTWTMDKLLELSGWARVADITADSLRTVMAKLTAAGYATNYVNKFTSRAKAFIQRMQENGRISSDPLAGVKRGNAAKGKKTRARRALLPEEAQVLLAAAPVGRRRIYLFAMLSGLRRGELKDLRWGDLRLTAPIPFIQLREEQTKNEKADALPLHHALIRILDEMGAGDENVLVFGVMPDMKSLARDLLNAGVATLCDDPTKGIKIGKGKYVNIADSRGRRTDFHAFRHTFKTWVDRTGCTEATSDALTRHGDKTVGDGYRHAELADMAEALASVPDPSPAEFGVTIATGTDDGARTIWRTTDGATIGIQAAAIGNTGAPCDGSEPYYNASVGGNRQETASIGHNLLNDNNLRPSTQVD